MNDCRERAAKLGCAVLIPTYNNAATLERVIDGVAAYCADVIVVNDGSTDATREILERRGDITLISYPDNRGKGHALRTGLRHAAGEGFRYAITLDSDGQHYADDIPAFIELIEQSPDTLIVGARNLEAENMPGRNSFANRFSNFWFRVETGLRLDDTQSGFRLYPLAKLDGMRFLTPRYEFEVEVMVRAAWRGVEVKNVPIKVFYPEAAERVSHFRPVRDFTRISVLNTFLVLVALLYYYPVKFVRWFSRENVKRFLREQVLHSKDSNARIACSVGLGVFCGIVPVWGYQMILAGVSAYALRLNKVISVVASNISIPPMIPFILYGSLAAGSLLMGKPVFVPLSEISFQTAWQSLAQYLLGSVALAVAAGLTLGALTFIILSIFRRRPRNE